MDWVGIVVAFVVGAGVVGVVLGQRVRELKRRASELETAKSSADIDRARFEERASQTVRLEEELRVREEAFEKLRSETEELRIKFQAIETSLAGERKNMEEQRKLLDEAQTKLKDAFDALASDALRKSNSQFLELAKEHLERKQEEAKGDLDKRSQSIEALVKPLSDQLNQYQTSLQKLDSTQAEREAKTAEQLAQLVDSVRVQQRATAEIKGLFKGPTSRGRVGEQLMERVLQEAGLESPLHYEMQASENTEEGRKRPDCVVKLTNGKVIVIDSKTPLNAYQDSLETEDDDARVAKLKVHAQNVKQRFNEVAKYDRIPNVQLKVMYLPIEASLTAAIQVDPGINVAGFKDKVVLATPNTLFALLQIVVQDWRIEDQRKHAQEIADLGKEMVYRIQIVANHISKVGANLQTATKSYNEAVSSIERNLLTTGKRFQKLGTGRDHRLDSAVVVESHVAEFHKPELLSLPGADRLAQLDAQDDLFALEESAEPTAS